MRCPKCGSDRGWEEVLLLHQYYNMRGEPNGSQTEAIGAGFVKCVGCGKRMKKHSIVTPPNQPNPPNKRKYYRKCGKCGDVHEQSEMIRTKISPNGWLCYHCDEEGDLSNVF